MRIDWLLDESLNQTTSAVTPLWWAIRTSDRSQNAEATMGFKHSVKVS